MIFSFALFPLVILAWRNPRLRWTLPFLFWIWASVHGSFAIGLAYVGLSLIAEREWRWLPTAIVTGLATLLTAHGLGVVTMLVDFLEVRETLGLLSEWRRPGLLSPTFVPFLGGLVFVVVGLLRRTIKPSSLIVIVPFALLGFTSMRAVPPAWLGLLPFVAQGASELRIGNAPRFSRPAAAIFAAVVFVLPFVVRGDGKLDDERFPVAAAQHLIDVNTFHDDRTGGYLIWEAGPEFLVYIDDRAELYGERMAEFVAVRNGDTDWQPVFERDGIERVLLPVDEDLVDRILAAGWTVEYQDDSFVVLVPRPG